MAVVVWTRGTKYEGCTFFREEGSALMVRSKRMAWFRDGERIELGDFMDFIEREDFADFNYFTYLDYFCY